jgi:hypothetical protein
VPTVAATSLKASTMTAAPCATPSPAVRHPRLGALVPALAVLAVFVLTAALGLVVDLDAATVPKPSFERLTLPGYPDGVSMKEAAGVTESGLWWLCLTMLLWVLAFVTVGACAWLLHRASEHDRAFRARLLRTFAAAAVPVGASLLALAAFGNKPFIAIMPLVANLRRIGPGFVTMANLNGALAFVVGATVLLAVSMLLWPASHRGHPGAQMRSITVLMYAAALFLAVWVATGTALYRLCASLLVADAREAALGLAPSISLTGGMFFSLALAGGYLAAVAWLAHVHARLNVAGALSDEAARDAPHAFLKLHWPKVAGILMPLLPGAASAVFQALTRTPAA